MEFKHYQKKAKKTIQEYELGDRINEIIPYLGIIGEAGSVVTELKKKLRDGNAYTNFNYKFFLQLSNY